LSASDESTLLAEQVLSRLHPVSYLVNSFDNMVNINVRRSE